MADILRVTTPIVEKNQSIQPKKGIDPTSPFNLQSTQKTGALTRQTPITRQHVGMPESDTPTILMNMLKDPGVMVSYLKNISLLEEIFKLLPANNRTMTAEIEQMFEQLFVQPEEIANELVNQEEASSLFKGAFFDFLRELGVQNPQRQEMSQAIADMLKATNNLLSRDDILDAVANSLEYLSKEMASSKQLSPQLSQLAAQFRQPDAQENAAALKEQALSLLDTVSESILFTPKLSKVVSITIYNLSRYNNSELFFQEASMRLRQMLGGAARRKVSAFSESLLTALREAKKAMTSQKNTASATGQTVRQDAANAQQATRETPQQIIARAFKEVFSTNNTEAQQPEQPVNEPQEGKQQETQQQEVKQQETQQQTQQANTQQASKTAQAEQILPQQTEQKHNTQNVVQQNAAALTPEQLAAQEKALMTQRLTSALIAAAQQRQNPFSEEMQFANLVGNSKVMSSMIKMLRKQSSNPDLSPSEADKLENILHSLLSSPCNFTPLLHFVIPSMLEDIRAFAEIWINPDSDEKDMPEGVTQGIHLLMVVDAEAIGRFEAEVFAYDKTVDINLFCPPEFERRFSTLVPDMMNELRGKGFSYRIGNVKLKPLAKARSLMDVFKSLPYKRVGVDVRI